MGPAIRPKPATPHHAGTSERGGKGRRNRTLVTRAARRLARRGEPTTLTEIARECSVVAAAIEAARIGEGLRLVVPWGRPADSESRRPARGRVPGCWAGQASLTPTGDAELDAALAAERSAARGGAGPKAAPAPAGGRSGSDPRPFPGASRLAGDGQRVRQTCSGYRRSGRPGRRRNSGPWNRCLGRCRGSTGPGVDRVIAGGEFGPGARPAEPTGCGGSGTRAGRAGRRSSSSSGAGSPGSAPGGCSTGAPGTRGLHCPRRRGRSAPAGDGRAGG